MKSRMLPPLVLTVWIVGLSCAVALAQCPISAPRLTTNPNFDVVVTRVAPVLSFKNATGGQGKRVYEIQLARDKAFAVGRLDYTLPENPEGVSALAISEQKPLADGTRWYWRVRATDEKGAHGPWAVSRFSVDTASDKAFMDLTRAVPVSVKVSSGSDPKNLIDYTDQGLSTQWRAAPPGPDRAWVELDLGRRRTISRIWMLADSGSRDGWPVAFRWLASPDGVAWKEVVKVTDGDTYRFILDVDGVSARFWRLEISDWTGYAPGINELLLYSPGHPPVPSPPSGPYVLVIGNQHNGATFTELAARVHEMVPELATVTVPYYEASMALYEALAKKPVAILLSGNNADYNDLPMFEYNGEFEIIRAAPVPILGICAGHQMLSFASGYTRVRSMGHSDISAMEKPDRYAEIRTLVDDPLFKGLPQPFTAPEVHGWAVYDLPPGFEVVAESTYIQAVRGRDGRLYGTQFHPEIKVSYNQAENVLRRFLRDALSRSQPR
ncbi:glutamine amidotransferase class-I [Solidesulfovibrio fructosivorans JJ]]|uniref:Glutamine amidotransferase class-I n=1 Tax=Solidesulfovibrio fructosivorans JJ] TaxID=596151 RepID=E1JX04_SOLFR|nr:discoidin domain-containing protein [Solidesulfovibrio fructosivorans]EFL51208.1 glutamine amidotransferase class-I [Solidesulfovibrio fructosivorans JJ]]